MKKICLIVLIVVLIITVLQGCASVKVPGNNDGLTEETGTTVPEDTILESESQTELSLEVVEEKDKKLKTDSFIKEDNKKGEKLESKTVEASKEDYLNIISNPYSILETGYIEGSIEMMNSKMHSVIIWSVEEAANPEGDSNKRQIKYIQLPSTMSDNIRYTRLEENFYGNLTESSLIFDDTNNEIYVLKNLNNINDETKDIRVDGAAKLKNDFKTINLNAIHMYTGNGRENILLSDKNNTLYIMDIETFEITKTMEMVDWETLSAYSYRKEAQATEWDNIFIYQINRKENIIRKYDILNDSISNEYDMKGSKMQGEILEIEKFDPTLRYVLVNNEGAYTIYLTREEDSMLVPVRKINGYADGTSFKKIDSIFATGMEVSGHWDDFVGIVQKDDAYPVKLINNNDTSWKKVE